MNDDEIRGSFTRIEDKLDEIRADMADHRERTATQGESIEWLRGFVRISIAAFVTLTGAVVSALFGVGK